MWLWPTDNFHLFTERLWQHIDWDLSGLREDIGCLVIFAYNLRNNYYLYLDLYSYTVLFPCNTSIYTTSYDPLLTQNNNGA